MNPTNPKTKPDTPEEIRNWLQDELRLTAAYWREQIQPFISKRKLGYVEFEIARSAYSRLEETVANAREWNAGNWSMGENKFNGDDAKQYPIPAGEFPSLETFYRPEPLPENTSLKPETLAAIAAPIIGKQQTKLLPSHAVHIARDLHAAAQDDLDALRKSKTRRLVERITTGNTVSFDEIAESNRANSGQLPLLPPIAQKKKGKSDQEIREKPLSKTAIRDAAVRFINDNASQRAIDDCLKNNRILLKDLCEMRLERFKNNSRLQRERAISREAKKNKRHPDCVVARSR